MCQKNSSLIDQVSFLYRIRLKVKVYLDNRKIKSSFGGRASLTPFMFVGIATALISAGAVWFLSEGKIATEYADKGASSPPAPGVETRPSEGPGPGVASASDKIGSDSADPASEPVEDASRIMKIRADLVNLRREAVLESEIKARLNTGYMVKVLRQKGDWIYADTGDGLMGWIYYELLEDASEAEFSAWKRNPQRFAAKQIIRTDLNDPGNMAREKRIIEEIINSWKDAWEKKDIDRYMAFYSRLFATTKYDWEGYRAYKGYLFKRPGFISVKISDIRLKWEDYLVKASFTQQYNSSTIKSVRRKVLHFQQENKDWKIIKETVVAQ